MSTLREALTDLRRFLGERPDELMQEVGAGGELLAARLRLLIAVLLVAAPALHYLLGGPLQHSFVALLGATALLLLSLLWLKLAQRPRRYRWLPYASACFDVLLVGAFLWLLATLRGNSQFDPLVAWSGYPLAIIGTALRNDARVTLLAGALALLQSLTLLWLLANGGEWLPATSASVLVLHAAMLLVLTLVVAVVVFRTQRLLQMAGSDGLTGLPNRSFLTHRVPGLLAEARADGQTLTLALIDLDHFRRVNEDLGHLAGDRALRHVVETLRLELGRDEPLLRVGGEEFVLLLRLPLGAAWERVDALRQRLAARPFLPEPGAEPLVLRFSAGLASMPQDANYLTDLMKRADQRVALAKRIGRNRVMARDSA
ncbi:MAG TPA: GGDEF domain-containing protein [Arenimonas sp.]|nr:GGDEF domain-containing protein [Arenimonas sp.]